MASERSHGKGSSRRTVLQGAAAFGAMAAAPSLVTVAARAQSVAKVSMQLGWLASNGIIGEVVGIAKGPVSSRKACPKARTPSRTMRACADFETRDSTVFDPCPSNGNVSPYGP